MKIQRQHKRYVLLIASSLLLMSLFQNCGQPGSIAVNDSQKATNTDGGGGQNPPPGNTYKDYEKTVTVNQSTGKVDVLVVIDNSKSMDYEQKNMADRFDSFLSKLKGLDWQVGIVTTDLDQDKQDSYRKDGRLLHFDRLNRYLINSTDDPNTAALAFSEVIQRPQAEGSGYEQGVKATYRALERSMSLTGPNVGLIRDGAALSVILVSDSDETVSDNDRPGDESTFTEKNFAVNLYNFVQKTYPGKTFKYNSIIVREGDQDCLKFPNSGNEAYGKQYQKLTNMTSGILGNVCEMDYSNQLSVIGDSTTESVRTVTLDCAPADSDGNGSVDLTVSNSKGLAVSGYTLNGRILTFAQPLPVETYKFAYRCLVQ